MISCPTRVVSDDDHLLHELQNSSARWERFPDRFVAYIEALSRRFMAERRTGEADREDAVQETYLYLIDPNRPRYIPARAAARTYLYYAVQTAFHAVLRRGKANDVELAAVANMVAADPANDRAVAPAQSRYDEREFVDYVFRDRPPIERHFLEEVASERTIQELSVDQGVSRPTMSRMVRRIRERLRLRALEALSA
jgi:DNA-directed RNA polymerase specialized sigma24 family protein